ncbi:MAG TPA: K(+)-transporting ATPase subunit C [Cytophagaceae bacterium]|jgi:K+-transporting ATPase ATPase C chain|nr:K(+)-transporting ATPase subunit C [Cytophagaceae bacterium]
MKEHVLPAIKLTLVAILFFSGLYTLLILGIAQFTPNKGKGFIVKEKEKVYYENIGQAFYSDRYFWSRPSAVSYNAAGSCGSNKGPSNADYLQQVQARIDTFQVHHPGVEKAEIPVDLITASGSGLDPHISPKAAFIQVRRIARQRNIPEEKITALVQESIDKPLFGIFGPEVVNVLELNLKLAKL